MAIDDAALERALREQGDETAAFLCDLIRIPSVRGHEGPVVRSLHERLRPFCSQAELLQIPEEFRDDPEYSWPLEGLSYSDTQNLRLTLQGSDPTARSLILNAHVDVVPPSGSQTRAFDPEWKDGVVYGRGACDDKGQIAVLYLVLRTLAKFGLRPRGTVTCDLVIEEENGGNGTLFMVRHPVRADGAVVMEPSDGRVYAAVRGAVWFELQVRGRAGHSGRVGDTVSALKEAIKGIAVLEEYHDRLLREARGKFPLFDVYENPMPVTFGVLEAGTWPATVPASATVKGVFGFLPDRVVREVQEGMVRAISTSPHAYLRENSTLLFTMLNNEGNVLSVDHPLVREVVEASGEAGFPVEISAMTAACDAWRYSRSLDIPTVVMGAGSLKHAHSSDEQIGLEDIQRMAKILIRFLERWCGLEESGTSAQRTHPVTGSRPEDQRMNERT
jgi:acetylornithine deacetylase/succinyl-diaminopimelate desuccinylase-like protein